MKRYLAVGFYSDNDQKFSTEIKARSPKAAERAYFKRNSDLVLVGLFELAEGSDLQQAQDVSSGERIS